VRKITEDFFDAAELGDGADLRTVLRKLLVFVIAAGRGPRDPADLSRNAKNILTMADAITQAGIDGEALVRFGLTKELTVPFAIELATGPSEESRLIEWREALGLGPPCTNRADAKALAVAVGNAINKALPTLTRWAYHAPFHDIANLVPPSAEVSKRIAEGPEPATDVCEQYRWIVDRLSGLVLRNWAQASLESEYDWRRGRRSANIPDAALIEISYTAEDLAVQIADNRLDQRVNDWDPLIEQVNSKACAFLREERYSDAAALFEFIGDHANLQASDCMNNRGFCWIPTEPERAMYYLERAASRGYQPAAVNVYNQMCCKVALKDYPGLRALSENYWSELFEARPVPARLWVRDGDDSWSLQYVPDARELIAVLALERAENEGWPDRVARWEMRLRALREGSHRV
jgi:hypothetical protein